jgi:hypothetical protein
MAIYLDPKNDLVFKRIFGSHPGLLISFLNALMPLETGRVIESIEYVSNELVHGKVFFESVFFILTFQKQLFRTNFPVFIIVGTVMILKNKFIV